MNPKEGCYVGDHRCVCVCVSPTTKCTILTRVREMDVDFGIQESKFEGFTETPASQMAQVLRLRRPSSWESPPLKKWEYCRYTWESVLRESFRDADDRYAIMAAAYLAQEELKH